MRESSEEVEFNQSMFQKALDEVSKKKPGQYDFILKSGNSYKDALFKLFKKVWEKEKKPESWRRTTILQIPKGTGEVGDMTMMRNIHLKHPIPKLFGHILMNQVKDKLMESMTKFQLGTKKGHRPQEHIFVLKSVMALYEMYKEGLLINLFDISKFFDKEELHDVLGEAYSGGLRGKYYKLMYEVNKNTIIKVRTAIGETEEACLDPGLGQGGVESGILSAKSLDKGVDDYFSDCTSNVSYGRVIIKSLLWQDDILKANASIKDAQECNIRMEAVVNSKMLEFNKKKSVFLVVGNKKFQEKIDNQLKESPLLLCNEKMLKVEKYPYL